MKLTPPGNKLLVELIVEETIRDSGLILVEEKEGKDGINPHSIHRAIVKYVGRKCEFVKEGDTVLLEYCFTRPFIYKGLDYKIITEDDIVGVVDEEN